jgi:hypothetical protein
MKIEYSPRNFHPPSLAIIKKAEEILLQFAGYVMTVRQVYYRFIALDAFPDSWIDEEYNKKYGLGPGTKNTLKNYKRLGSLLNDARLAGLIDWDLMEDRTRNLMGLRHWDDPPDAINWLKDQYRVDKWKDQPCRVEVWIEKDALLGVFERICNEVDVPFFSCRGYNSQSEMWGSSQRLTSYQEQGQTPVILHFTDHDPSGLDMTRDTIDRLEIFLCKMNVSRRALTMAQVKKYNLPPNPAKETDARFKTYVKKHGDESWELDALEPPTLTELVRRSVADVRDEATWKRSLGEEAKQRDVLRKVAHNWLKVEKFTKKMKMQASKKKKKS